ncbi:MAG: hypothetical protein M3044_11815 [Thermoproteota archaeon]|nr:hypothetical protein [Thermoproteota archaeon]
MNSSDFHQENTTPSVSAKAKEASKSFRELVGTLGKKAKILTTEKTQQLKEKTTAIVVKGHCWQMCIFIITIFPLSTLKGGMEI